MTEPSLRWRLTFFPRKALATFRVKPSTFVTTPILFRLFYPSFGEKAYGFNRGMNRRKIYVLNLPSTR
jgi:hypothetical protein